MGITNLLYASSGFRFQWKRHIINKWIQKTIDENLRSARWPRTWCLFRDNKNRFSYFDSREGKDQAKKVIFRPISGSCWEGSRHIQRWVKSFLYKSIHPKEQAILIPYNVPDIIQGQWRIAIHWSSLHVTHIFITLHSKSRMEHRIEVILSS